jgi:cobalt transporter subunit CbtB
MLGSLSRGQAVATTKTGYLPALFAIALGLFFVYGVGFAGPTSIHNAAHDTRHSFAFPCH